MDLITELRACIGQASTTELACDAVEAGAVRRFAQAIMDESADYAADAGPNRYGGAIAPPLFVNHSVRRPLGTPDPLQQRADDPDFDGYVPQGGLPELEALKGYVILNGGAEFEFYRYARHGERVLLTQRYVDFREKKSASGPLIACDIESEFRTPAGELLLRARRTQLRRPP